MALGAWQLAGVGPFGSSRSNSNAVGVDYPAALARVTRESGEFNTHSTATSAPLVDRSGSGDLNHAELPQK